MDRRTQNRWHVNGDGSLCTVQAAEDWQPRHTAADLVRKASCWLVEYLLVDAGDLDAMTKRGIYSDESVDALLALEVLVMEPIIILPQLLRRPHHPLPRRTTACSTPAATSGTMCSWSTAFTKGRYSGQHQGGSRAAESHYTRSRRT